MTATAPHGFPAVPAEALNGAAVYAADRAAPTSPFAVTRTPNLLETRMLKAGYLGREVVSGVNITVQPGEVVALLGPDGAGKTTTLLTIAGQLAPVDGIVMFSNVPTFTPMYQRVRQGVGLVTEERLVFTKMSTRDNLRIGGGDVDRALALFPTLEARLDPGGVVIRHQIRFLGPESPIQP